MGRIVLMNHLTLDGVMQGSGPPAKPLEVVFSHSGWGSR
jgi:hypothetical protein